MMRSMFSGVSGLRVHQSKMDVIANNISNVNTVGYKSSRVTFAEVFSQTLSGATGPNAARRRGGTNPQQIGLGVTTASIDKLMTGGAAQRTDNPLDLMIQGEGFFIVSDINGQFFTRAGNFIEDSQGFLTQNGLKLMGWDSVWDAAAQDFAINRMSVQPLQITPEKEFLSPSATTVVGLQGNINPNTDPVVQRSMSFYDSIGTKYLLDVVLTYDAPASAAGNTNIWNVSFPINAIYPNGDRSLPQAIGPIAAFPISFDTDGRLATVNNAATTTQTEVTVAPTGTLIPAATLGTGTGIITLDFGGLHQFVNESTNAMADNSDGNAPGRLSGMSVGTDGRITGRYSNGLVRLLGQIPVAQFKNPAGLEKMGNNLFASTNNSGPFDGVGVDGELRGGVLEMSNVDLGMEFTEMITTQRGFQANSRIITASDTMLQELVNLVR